MRGLVDHLELFIGTDPMDLDRHAAVLANVAFHDGRPWPLEVALWDLVGKLTARPIWEMLGGDGRGVRAYASSGTLRSRSETIELALEAEAAEFGGLKLRFGRPSIEGDLEVLEGVRSATSESLELMVDRNQGWRMPWDTEAPWDLDQRRGWRRGWRTSTCTGWRNRSTGAITPGCRSCENARRFWWRAVR